MRNRNIALSRNLRFCIGAVCRHVRNTWLWALGTGCSGVLCELNTALSAWTKGVTLCRTPDVLTVVFWAITPCSLVSGYPHNPEDHNRNLHCRENLKPCISSSSKCYKTGAWAFFMRKRNIPCLLAYPCVSTRIRKDRQTYIHISESEGMNHASRTNANIIRQMRSPCWGSNFSGWCV
jgi:hypothetical protein